ncbi:Cytochrome C oxidase subunit IV [Cribrihabitans marinus]|uniref:Cytochrome C oxidase subunit IV n=1 Tax=Cribrihabitans marinus TaxID=1227549 RepID=A0A1H7DPX7_9RHOB|nr:cytochrome C oxidase subunit IV family protein [Cribrihabitans marinus]SEK02917.1 Cytochrome C oxidase subunit IV [Cribrihabitans marinus]
MTRSSPFSKYSNPDPLTRAWAGLVALSLATTALTLAGLPARLTGALVLLLALLKARVILARYLELDRAPRLLAGFTAAIVAAGALILVLYLV